VDERNVTVGGQQIAFTQSEGRGRPVIFVHGNFSSARTWHPMMTGPFGQRFRCLALDLPGHGSSAPAKNSAKYSLPGYAAVLTGFAETENAADAVIVGWSLGGHVALEAASAMPEAAGFVLFGAPPVASAAQLSEAFMLSPALNAGYTEGLEPEAAQAFAAGFLAPGSALPLDEFTDDILRSDGQARAGLFASIGEGRFADEIAIASTLAKPLAILQGEGELLVSLDYLRRLTIPSLWRGQVQLIPGAGHAPHRETPAAFVELLDQFIADLS
jgi:pimeloyl-ACP methyl ester carboxylesterase